MIRINLLPVRAAKKKETAVQQIVIFCISLLLVAAIALSYLGIKKYQISNTNAEIKTANKTIEDLKEKTKKLDGLTALKAQVTEKLKVLSQLRKNKVGPAQRLATLSAAVPEQLWLTAYFEAGSVIKMSGVAYTEELIADFMRSLEKEFTSVELGLSEQLIDPAGIKMKKFEISCKLKSGGSEAPKK